MKQDQNKNKIRNTRTESRITKNLGSFFFFPSLKFKVKEILWHSLLVFSKLMWFSNLLSIFLIKANILLLKSMALREK